MKNVKVEEFATPKAAQGFSYRFTNNSIVITGSLSISKDIADEFCKLGATVALDEDITLLNNGSNNYILAKKEFKYNELPNNSIYMAYSEVNKMLYDERNMMAALVMDTVFYKKQCDYKEKYNIQ